MRLRLRRTTSNRAARASPGVSPLGLVPHSALATAAHLGSPFFDGQGEAQLCAATPWSTLWSPSACSSPTANGASTRRYRSVPRCRRIAITSICPAPVARDRAGTGTAGSPQASNPLSCDGNARLAGAWLVCWRRLPRHPRSCDRLSTYRGVADQVCFDLRLPWSNAVAALVSLLQGITHSPLPSYLALAQPLLLAAAQADPSFGSSVPFVPRARPLASSNESHFSMLLPASSPLLLTSTMVTLPRSHESTYFASKAHGGWIDL
jgi:hypothetical protein